MADMPMLSVAAPQSMSSNLKATPKGNGGGGKKKRNSNDPPLRQGKWTREEEEYVNCLIDEFKTGMMPLAEGTSLRTFLSKMLNCHPMRISKKFVGSNYNGKQVYTRRTGADRLSNDEVRDRRAKLCDLERKFLAKIALGGARGRGGPPSAPVPPASASASAPESLLNMQHAAAASNNNLASVLSLQNLAQGVDVSNSGIELRNLINQSAVNQRQNPELSRNIGMLSASLNRDQQLASSHSLQNLFEDLVKSTSSNGELNNSSSTSTDSLQAFQAMLQQQASHAAAPKSNSRAAAAGRALLQSGGGFGLGLGSGQIHHHQAPAVKPSDNGMTHKDLGTFSSAELAAELRKRSSLKDLMASLTGACSDSKPPATSSSLQNSFQQAAGATHAQAFSSLIRNSSIDMSSLIERQGSIDSLSNLAVRSRLQSIHSLGSLLDPLLEGVNANANSTTAGNHNSNWNPTAANAARAISASGLNLASLLNNEDALRRLEASAPSSLHHNFAFQNQENGGSNHAVRRPQQQQQSNDSNTAIAQFLLQKQLLEQAGGKKNGNNEQEQLRRDVAAAAAGGGTSSGAGNNGGADPIMSSLLSQLRSSVGGDDKQQPEDSMEALKRKFFSPEALVGQQQNEQRRAKPFR